MTVGVQISVTTSDGNVKNAGKRTRFLNTKQSKYGCITCKTRKIKCDEEQPACLRCQRSGRICEGYAKKHPLALRPKDSSSSPTEMSTGTVTGTDKDALVRRPVPRPLLAPCDIPWVTPQQNRLAKLGCIVLASDPLQIQDTDRDIWTALLPQLSHVVPCVNAAAAAFGAAYDATFLNRGDSALSLVTTKQYGLALKLLQDEIRAMQYGRVPLLLACTLLAAAESIQSRHKNARSHMMGAFKILTLEQEGSFGPAFAGAASSNVLTNRPGAATDMYSLETFFLGMDLQITSYSGSAAPFIPAFTASETSIKADSMEHLLVQPFKLLHACYHFIAQAARYKYRNPHDWPSEVIFLQSRLTSSIREWLRLADLKISSAQYPVSGELISPYQIRQLLLLKAQSLCVLIFASVSMNPLQKAYDQFTAEFEDLMQCAELIMDPTTNPNTARPSPLAGFRNSPGIIQPLFFAAWKYRHSLRRRRAVELLRSAGVEGPWNGPLEANVASRIIQLEEEAYTRIPESERPLYLPGDIDERFRVYGCQRLADLLEDSERAYQNPVKFSRCRNMEFLVSSGLYLNGGPQWENWLEDVQLLR